MTRDTKSGYQDTKTKTPSLFVASFPACPQASVRYQNPINDIRNQDAALKTSNMTCHFLLLSHFYSRTDDADCTTPRASSCGHKFCHCCCLSKYKIQTTKKYLIQTTKAAVVFKKFYSGHYFPSFNSNTVCIPFSAANDTKR